MARRTSSKEICKAAVSLHRTHYHVRVVPELGLFDGPDLPPSRLDGGETE